MMGVGCHALHDRRASVERRLTRSVSPFQSATTGISHGVPKGALRSPDDPGEKYAPMDGVIKIDIGQRGEQAVHQKAVGLRRPVVPGCCGKLDQGADQLILQCGSIRLLAAYAGAHAALVAGGLLALKAKHLRQRSYSSLFRRAQPDWARLHLLLAFPSFRSAIQAAPPAIDTRCAPSYNKENVPDRIENRLDRKRSVSL